MFLKRTQALLDAAAEPVLDAIRSDRARASQELKSLLSYIEAHLFDLGFSVEAMKTACGARDNSVVTRFRRELSLTPRAYTTEHRLQVGREILKHPELEIWMVAELVGFSSPQVFSRNFRKRFKVSPGGFRQQLAAAKPGVDDAVRDFSLVELHQGFEGLLEPDRGRALVRELQAHYPPGVEASEPADAAKANIDPEVVWEQIRNLAPEDQLAVIVEHFSDAGRAVFELLSAKSREEGRCDRQHGVQLAELALKSLDVCASALGGELPSLRALAWARLGNARRLALDFTAAEEAFRQAALEWSMRHTGRDPEIEGEILFLKGGFRAIQHRFAEATELANQARSFLKDGCQPRLLAKTLILRARINDAEGCLEASIADLSQAIELVDPHDGRLRLTVCHNLVTAYMIAERFDDADEMLPLVQSLCTAHGEPLERFQLLWVEGRVAKGLGRTHLAEESFVASHTGFSDMGERGHASVVAVDLALIYCEQGRPEAVRYAAEAIPILDTFKIRSEAVTARRILALAVARDHVTLEVLYRVRAVLSGLVRDPSIRLPTTS